MGAIRERIFGAGGLAGRVGSPAETSAHSGPSVSTALLLCNGEVAFKADFRTQYQ